MGRSTSTSPPAPAAEGAVVPDDRRQRRRERTRAEIAAIALRLATERGYDHVTVEDIADEADIAARTFFRYFATKDDVFFLERDEKLRLLRDTFAGRPADEPVRTSVRATMLLLAETYEDDRDGIIAKHRLVQDTPSLRARAIEHQSQWQRIIAELVADRLGVDVDRDLLSQVVAATTVASMQAAFNVWLARDDGSRMQDLLAEALHLVDDPG